MNKVFLKASVLSVFLAPALLMAGAPLEQAQVYSTYGTTVYPTSNYTTPVYSTPSYAQPSTSCIELTAPMTIGDSDYLNGGQVSELQTFLVRDGLLSSAYVTGYYGNLTASAVAQFQASRGISPVGVVGPETRSAIEQVSCGNSGIGIVSPANPIYPTNPLYPVNPGGPIQYGRPDLNSLSVNYNGPTAVITIQGYELGSTNTVYFGNEAITGVSSNGTTLSFTAPSVAPGNYEIYVTNSYGESNSLSYTVGNNTNNNCYLLNGNYQCNCATPVVYSNNTSFSYNGNNCNNNSSQVILTSVSGSGSVGGTATIYGSGFTTNNNAVYFGGTEITGVYSSNGTSLTFTIPSIASNNYGNESVYVTNGNGISSNTIQFTLNSSSYTYGQIGISYLSPTSGDVGTQIEIEGSGFTQDNTVHFGNGGSTDVQSYNNGSVIYFTVPSGLSPCGITTTGICPEYEQVVTEGSYPIYVTNQNNDTSNTVYFQVN